MKAGEDRGPSPFNFTTSNHSAKLGDLFTALHLRWLARSVCNYQTTTWSDFIHLREVAFDWMITAFSLKLMLDFITVSSHRQVIDLNSINNHHGAEISVIWLVERSGIKLLILHVTREKKFLSSRENSMLTLDW